MTATSRSDQTHQKTLPFVELLNFFGSSVCAIAFCGLFHCDWHSTRRSGVCLSVVTEEIAILACWRGPGVRIPMAQKLFSSGFLSVALTNWAIMSTPTVHRRCGVETARERIGHSLSYAEARKMRELSFDVNGCLLLGLSLSKQCGLVISVKWLLNINEVRSGWIICLIWQLL